MTVGEKRMPGSLLRFLNFKRQLSALEWIVFSPDPRETGRGIPAGGYARSEA